MTLIVTQISRHGIAHASDSNISNAKGETIGTAKKCFEIPKLNAGLTVAGAFGVGTVSMDSWMDSFIYNSKSATLENFAEDLRDALENQMSDKQKEAGSLIHIAGYVEKDGKFHPEFWFVRNVYEMTSGTGEYSDIRKQFIKSEDFWNRDNKNNEVFKALQSDDQYYQLYINGFTPGRIGYNIVQQQLQNFFREIWNNKTWKFRAPRNIDEVKILIETYMKTINSIFLLSDYPGQLIGGDTQFALLPQPNKIDV